MLTRRFVVTTEVRPVRHLDVIDDVAPVISRQREQDFEGRNDVCRPVAPVVDGDAKPEGRTVCASSESTPRSRYAHAFQTAMTT
jgi:hypothetical protein